MLARSALALVPALLLAACASPTDGTAVGDATSATSEIVSGSTRYSGSFVAADGEDLRLTIDYRLDLAHARQELVAEQIHTSVGVFGGAATCLSQTFVPADIRIVVTDSAGKVVLTKAQSLEASSADRGVPCPGAVAQLDGTPHDAVLKLNISFVGLLEQVDGHGIQIPSTSGYGETTSFPVSVDARFVPAGRPTKTTQRNDQWVRQSTLVWSGAVGLEMPRTLKMRVDPDASGTMGGSFDDVNDRQQIITLAR